MVMASSRWRKTLFGDVYGVCGGKRGTTYVRGEALCISVVLVKL